MKLKVLVILFGLITMASSPGFASDIIISDAWIRAMPQTSNVLACYLRINNRSTQSVYLESITSDDFGSVEIHSTKMRDGMVHMGTQNGLRINAGTIITLQPGGLHLMLIDGKRALHAGDAVLLKMHFSDGETIEANAEVRK